MLCVFFMWFIIRSDRDGLRGVIDKDWVHSNLCSDRNGLWDFIDVLRCLLGFRSDRDGLRVLYWYC
jgi:hypothetical protein